MGFCDLDRKVEHRAGKSVWELVIEDGAERYRRLEGEQLVRALRDRPFGILTLGDGALIDPAGRRRVLEESTLVVLDYDLAGCFWRLLTRPAPQHDWWHPLHREPLLGPEQLRPFVDARRRGLEAAPHRIRMRGRTLAAALAEVRALLPVAA
ncbi:MAG: hypothetical protein D6696_05370 [Acidobacteria bacterium]|nr:MAG: hypothetical protein D6696_05370 [Acidobacteriota bacterium]